MYCSKCGKDMMDGQEFCDKCGTKAGTAAGGAPPQQQQTVYVREKSEGLAAVLSLLWSGLGQVYVGRIARGLGIMVLGFILSFVLFVVFFPLLILLVVYWIWNIFDAYKLAQQYNDSLRSSGRRPW